jgi:hypothetical protein
LVYGYINSNLHMWNQVHFRRYHNTPVVHFYLVYMCSSGTLPLRAVCCQTCSDSMGHQYLLWEMQQKIHARCIVSAEKHENSVTIFISILRSALVLLFTFFLN